MGGRPKQTEEMRMKRQSLLAYMAEYLESGEAVVDFNRLRQRSPDKSIDIALTRTFGAAKSLDPPAPSLEINFNIRDPRSVSSPEHPAIEAERVESDIPQQDVKVAFRINGKNGNGNGNGKQV